MVVTRWGDERRWVERHSAFGSAAERFWRWQESTADALWDLALRFPAWPPQTIPEGVKLASDGLAWLGADWRRMNPPIGSRCPASGGGTLAGCNG
jgi:hypothetical protein